MINFMKKSRNIYYNKRKKLFFRFSKYNHLLKPYWVIASKDNRFESTYRDQKLLLKEGRVVIGCLVQANTLLFEPGNSNSPANMVFSEEPYFEENPDKLEHIASKLFNLKISDCNDKELQVFSDVLKDEIVPLFNAKVPEKMTFGKKVYFTTFMVDRNHTPHGYIDFTCFPVIVCPEKTEASTILPSKYWASKLN